MNVQVVIQGECTVPEKVGVMIESLEVLQATQEGRVKGKKKMENSS